MKDGTDERSFDRGGLLFLAQFIALVTLLIFVAGLLGGLIGASNERLEEFEDSGAILNTLETPESLSARFLSTFEGLIRDNPQLLPGTITTLDRETISSSIPPRGKFIGVDLVSMKLFLYEDGRLGATYSVLSKGRPGSYWETPTGTYTVLTKERIHLSSIGLVYMPYSMQFFGNFFIHGWPYYPDGKPVPRGYSGGCVRLSTEDARRVFDFAELGIPIFVYDESNYSNFPKLFVRRVEEPEITARSYLIGDMATGDIYFEKDANRPLPIASITKLMTAVVANEVINFDRNLMVVQSKFPGNNDRAVLSAGETFRVKDTLYPLLLESSNTAAESLARVTGTDKFIQLMNEKAKALGMKQTIFKDPSGVSHGNISSPRDLFRLGSYLYEKKSFILNMSKKERVSVTTPDGRVYEFRNFHPFAIDRRFYGGKTGENSAAGETLISIFSVTVGGQDRPIVVIVLGSFNRERDTQTLISWFEEAVSVADESYSQMVTSPPELRGV